MHKILPFLIFVSIIISSFSICSSEDSILYRLDNGQIISDISYDTNIDSFYIAGTFKNGNDSFIVKSKNNQVLRQEIIKDFIVKKILIDKFSNIYVLGNKKDNNISLIRVTPSLNKRWETILRVSEKDILTSFTINDNQEVSVLGYSTNKRVSDIFIVKINSDGKIINEEIIDIGPFERPYEILEDKSKNIYITGEVRDKDLDIFLIKLSKDYELLWVDYFDNNGWEDGGLDLELIDEDVILTGYSGKEGWYVFDTVFIRYSPEGNLSTFSRKGYSKGSDWIRQLNKNGDIYYVLLWDILTGREYVMKLDYYFDVITKNEIPRGDHPIKILNALNNTYLVFQNENKLYLRGLN